MMLLSLKPSPNEPKKLNFKIYGISNSYLGTPSTKDFIFCDATVTKFDQSVKEFYLKVQKVMVEKKGGVPFSGPIIGF
jgi:hypothetical protein